MYVYVENNPINYVDPTGKHKEISANQVEYLLSVADDSKRLYKWAKKELLKSVHFYGTFNHNQFNYLLNIALQNNGPGNWAKQQLVDNITSGITIDDLYYLYVLGDNTVTENDREIENKIKAKLFWPVFKDGLFLFTAGVLSGLEAIELVYLLPATAAQVRQYNKKYVPDVPEVPSKLLERPTAGDNIGRQLRTQGIGNAVRSVGYSGQNIVYRVIRNDENPILGLSAKNPNRGMSIEGHVTSGSRNNGSQFISSTTDISIAKKWAKKIARELLKLILKSYLPMYRFMTYLQIQGGQLI